MEKISFLINCSNDTLKHLKLLVNSLLSNLKSDEHEILIFVDSDNEGTFEWLMTQKPKFKDLKIITHKVKPCIGYARNNNLLVEMAKYPIVSYLQSDMVISQDYDEDVLRHVKPNMILSSTRVEPPLHGTSHEVITKDFGLDPEGFNLMEFNEFAQGHKSHETGTEFFFAPFTFYKDTWLKAGGYDTIFRRSREDSDLLMRFRHQGVDIRQTFGAIVYHFTCVTSRGKDWFKRDNEEAQKRVETQQSADIIELRRFLRKWGQFSHTEKINKYDCDFAFNFSPNLSLLGEIEPYFSRVWVPSNSVKQAYITQLEQEEHIYANKLLGFTENDWNNASRYYNKTYLSPRIRIGKPEQDEYKVLVAAPLPTQENQDQWVNEVQEVCHTINKVIEQYEIGQYEYGNLKIDIRKKSVRNPHLKVVNPIFDMSLLEVN
jgi:GT2 family glycosyltransferase